MIHRLFSDKQLIELYEKGLNDREISERLGTARSTVNGRRLKLGLKARGHKAPFTDKQLIELYEKGLNDREISERLGTARSTVQAHRIKLRLPVIGA
jgi:DNA-binding NarL/FixJ family response regulator